ncbi:hypothetical protein AMATHDRAFT_153113 [Amanita thiersii Skay4041]|uniref:FAD-binding FR-type domain-containing protein n=1 Tax=Amanita thiersii Skay4041 TaxID=703135 RepID=A0A2A9NFK1_9AGAR|nr:hypothetical protein AMATHDRAFT_153113 [Amanita thiersii Skay4041]
MSTTAVPITTTQLPATSSTPLSISTPQSVLPEPQVQALVFHVHLFIAGCIALVVLLRLPRGLVRFWKPSEWCSGHFFRRVRFRERAKLTRAPRHGQVSRESSRFASTDESHTLCAQTATRAIHFVDHKGRPLKPSYPPHVPSCPSILRPLVGPLRKCIIPGYSNLQVLIMVAYLAVLLYPFIYRSNFLVEAQRAGWIAVAQLPFLIAFAAKNNVVGWLLGVGYQNLNFLHRYIGRLIVLAANVHSIDYFYRWSFEGTVALNFRRASIIWAMVALVGLDLMFIFSTSFWRAKAFNVFSNVHFFTFVLVIPSIYIHKPTTLPYIIALLFPFGIDYGLRILKTRYVSATIRPLPALNATRIEIPSINTGWRAGQHVRVRIVSSSMFSFSWFGWTESHPFTIASAPVLSGSGRPAVGEEGMVLICKKSGNWTGTLFEMAKRSGYIESGLTPGGVDIGRSVKLLVQGPYGGPGHAMFASYSAVVLIVGGSGITLALSVIQDLVQKDLHRQSRVKAIELVWMVQDPGSLTPVMPLFAALVHSSPSFLTISTYYTRAFVPPSEKHAKAVKEGRAGRPGRIGLTRVMENAISSAVSISGPDAEGDDRGINGMLVGICGPRGLSEDVFAAADAINPARRDQVGGVEIHEE